MWDPDMFSFGTTVCLSPSFANSAIENLHAGFLQNSGTGLNLQAPAVIVLGCVAVESFCNEVSAKTLAMHLESEQLKRVNHVRWQNWYRELGLGDIDLESTGELINDSKGSFYDRYKLICRGLHVPLPDFSQDIRLLKTVRDALVHYRQCAAPVIRGPSGGMVLDHKIPRDLLPLEKMDYGSIPLLSENNQISWTLRLSTSAFACWAMETVLRAILHIINQIPDGEFHKAVLGSYGCSNTEFSNIFDAFLQDTRGIFSIEAIQDTKPAG